MNDKFISRMERESAKKNKLKNKLAEEHGVVGNPKLDACFDLAWQYGHACGLGEVEGFFEELVDLIQ